MTARTQTPVAVASWPEPVPPGSSMRAMVFRAFGGPEVLEPADVPTPSAGFGEVVVQVAAVAVGRYLDLAARAGTHPFPGYRFPHTLGAEHAGVVAALGAGVTDWHVGQRVAVFPNITCGTCRQCVRGYDELCESLQLVGMHRPGAYAQYVAVPAENLHEVPPGISPESATALALAGPVVLNQLKRSEFAVDQWVLVQGASGALGSLTASLVQHLGGHAIGMSRGPDKRARLQALGFDAVLDPGADDVLDAVKALTAGRGVDIVVDNLGDPKVWSLSLAALATGGRVVSSGAFLGHQLPVDLRTLYIRGQHVIGVRTGNKASVRSLWEQVGRGFRPVLDTTFPLADAAAAHRFLETDSHVGRVTLIVPRQEVSSNK